MIPKTIIVSPLTLHVYGFVFALSILFGWALAKKRAHQYKIPKQILDDPILLLPLILGIFGARAYHVLDYWELYSQDLLSIFNLAGGGLGIWGGLLSAFVGFAVIARIKKLNLLSFLDLVAPSFLLGQALGRFGNYVNKEGFGPPTNLPWGVYIDPASRPDEFVSHERFHPTFFYEAAIDFLLFIILIALSPKLKKGQAFALYLIFYASGRFATEFFRIDTWKVGDLKIAYVLSVLTACFGFLLFRAKNLGLKVWMKRILARNTREKPLDSR